MCQFIDKGFARFEGPFDSNIALFSTPCCSDFKKKINLAKQHTTFSYGNATNSEMIQCIYYYNLLHRRVLPETGK